MAVKNEKLIPLFNQVKKLIVPFAKYFTVIESEGEYGLVHKGAIEFNKYKRDEVYFVGIIIQKHYLGFYFVPQYTTDKKPGYFSGPALLKVLKGKSCYYITEKAFTPKFQEELKIALEKGLEEYKKLDWVK